MAWFAKPKSKKEQIEEQRRRRRGDAVALSLHWLNFRQVLGAFLFVVMAVAVTFICFVGLSPASQQLVASQRRVVAAFPFSYTSNVLTEHARRLASELVGPSFKQPDHVLEDRMKQAVADLAAALDQYQRDAANLTPDEQPAVREKLARDFQAKHSFDLDPNDVVNLTAKTDAKQRTQAFEEALTTIHGLLNRGIFDATKPGFQATATQGVMYNLDIPGRISPSPVLSQDEALREFHINLAPLEVDAPAKAAIYNLLKQTLAPNIQFDKERTERTKTAAMDAIKPVMVQVHEGQVLADPSAPVYSPDEQRGLLQEYFAQLRQHTDLGPGFSHVLVQRFLFTTLLLLAALIFIKSGLAQYEHSPKFYALMATLILVNLLLLRFVIGIGSTSLFAQRPEYLAILPWLAPTMLAPILVAIMIGTAPAVLTALMISMLYAMMTGDALEVFLVNFLASLVAVYFCRDVRVRVRLVRAGVLGGLAAAVCAAYVGLLNPSALAPLDIARQMFAAPCAGFLTAVAAIGLLPVCENLFKITTDITLLELTDFNHPLLRKLQLVAPGSYHHSLMVANLSERAALEVSANPLLCRACSLFHDVGKIIKPEYFTENQRDGFNPHEEVSPSMSALIIKSHVAEGLDLARQHKLPGIIQNVISQHHGTTLIKFFYHKATKQQRLLTQTPFTRQRAAKAAARDDTSLDESFYRYDGPKPNFKESAIIALADCLEAASRSLRKVTPQSVEELIESLVNDRIEDHQLDDSPITIQELKKIKESFASTLLNMLHSRVQYPGEEPGDAPPSDKAKDQPPAPVKAAAPAPVEKPTTAAAHVPAPPATA